MTKLRKQDSTTKPVKENVVDGVLQNYLDQLLVTATQPQRVEKTIHIPETTEKELEVPIAEVPTAEAPIEVALNISSDSTANFEPFEQVHIARVELVETKSSESVSADKTIEVIAEVNSEQQQQLLTEQESWSSQGVECLIFSVCGLKLAVPLLFLGGVHEVQAGDIKPLIGQQRWYLGMVHTDECNLQVIDTANFIMPERSRNLVDEGFKYLIQLEKTPWAIACQSIDDTVRLEASEIKWRGDRGKRAWLAGTVIEKMCALVDVSGLLQEVELNCRPA